MQKIRRKRTIEGTTMPGIIHNGGQYFMIDLNIYEDGMADCWELVDLDGLRGKLESGWLTPTIPAGRPLSIHGLGSYVVESARWLHDTGTYYEAVLDRLKRLNPEMSNLYTVTETQKKLAESRRVQFIEEAVPFYVRSETFYETAEGRSIFLFMRREGRSDLIRLTVYEDGTAEICDADREQAYSSMAEVEALFADGTLFTEFDRPVDVTIAGLGELRLSAVLNAAPVGEKRKEAADLLGKLQGGKTTLELCRDAYHRYLEEPSERRRAFLKERYEDVPEHQRLYLGDMDTRDEDYRRILYTPEDTREV
ncbi:hypothetical protein GYN08_16630 [Saccharibacillus sp. VR-M41]|uniref:Uncharacterized protein n=2 Tax=Saccharibacillus alkalitolerans TaxID=2705290 RepID=A0ABX0FBT4_9BACL|nr:hypothetical protein [Saccharibacillus alkalitolerans]